MILIQSDIECQRLRMSRPMRKFDRYRNALTVSAASKCATVFAFPGEAFNAANRADHREAS